MEDDIEMSPLNQALTSDGKTVQVEIYRGDGEGWILEIIDEFGNSTVWDEPFDTYAAPEHPLKRARARPCLLCGFIVPLTPYWPYSFFNS